ncbi:MAG: hypothetical protein M3Q88_02905 [Pseudomonadota bacterium]|nr:hypothetical protein [Pseudomonadota bacterium]
MQHKHDIFAGGLAVRKRWTSPKLTSTKLSDEELQKARSSPDNFVALGRQLKAGGRI